MAFTVAPDSGVPATTNFDGWTEDGSNVTFPIASVPQLTAAEADATTGDIRKVIFAMVDKFWDIYNSAANKPVKMAAYKSTSVNDTAGTITRQYTFTFNVDGSYEVSDEA